MLVFFRWRMLLDDQTYLPQPIIHNVESLGSLPAPLAYFPLLAPRIFGS